PTCSSPVHVPDTATLRSNARVLGSTFALTVPHPTGSTPFPYTTLFRSTIARRFSAAELPRLREAGGQDEAAIEAKFQFSHFDGRDRKSTRLNSSHVKISYAVFCLKKKTTVYAKDLKYMRLQSCDLIDAS